MRANPRLARPLELTVITAYMWLALPFAIGLFPQTSSTPVTRLEPRFQNLLRPPGPTPPGPRPPPPRTPPQTRARTP